MILIAQPEGNDHVLPDIASYSGGIVSARFSYARPRGASGPNRGSADRNSPGHRPSSPYVPGSGLPTALIIAAADSLPNRFWSRLMYR